MGFVLNPSKFWDKELFHYELKYRSLNKKKGISRPFDLHFSTYPIKSDFIVTIAGYSADRYSTSVVILRDMEIRPDAY